MLRANRVARDTCSRNDWKPVEEKMARTQPLPSVLVYRRNLLTFSETFIHRQVKSLNTWQPTLVGQPMDDGLSLDDLDLVPLELPDPSIRFAEKPKAITLREKVLRSFLKDAPRPTRPSPYAYARAIAQQLQKESWYPTLLAKRPRLLHVHFGTNAEEAWPLSLALNIPIVVTLHGYDAGIYPKWWESGQGGRRYRHYPSTMRAMDLHNTKFIAVSDAIVECAQDLGIRKSSIRKILIGVDTSSIRPSALPITHRPPRILFVGRFVEKKGLDLLLRAFADISASVPDSELRIIGAGKLESQLKSTVSSGRITFVGRLSPDQVLHEMHHARVLCVPSVRATNGDSEGLPTVIPEAQASGLPVVTSARGGRTEGILDGVTGIAFPERDHAALVKSLIRCLTDLQFATNASAAARQFAERHLDMAMHTAALEQYYDEVSAPSAFTPDPVPLS